MQMRTRFFNCMNDAEIMDYLKRNDVIFIPIGTVSAHGTFPLDVDHTFASGLAYLMAEEVDGIVMGHLPFFYSGTALIGRGTVHVPIKEGVKFLKELSYSLLNQGFRRQIYVGTNEFAHITAGTTVVDFFDETKCPISFMDLKYMFGVANENVLDHKFEYNRYTIDKMIYGAYKILGKDDEILIDPNAQLRSEDCTEAGFVSDELSALFAKTVRPAGAVAYYFEHPDDHYGAYGALRSIEQRNIVMEEGEKLLKRFVDALFLSRYVDSMKKLDKWTNTVIKEEYGAILPKNKFSEWK